MTSRVTVQAFKDGQPVGEWIATSETKTVQQMVDWMFANGKQGIGFRFLGEHGFIDPSSLSLPSIAL